MTQFYILSIIYNFKNITILLSKTLGFCGVAELPIHDAVTQFNIALHFYYYLVVIRQYETENKIAMIIKYNYIVSSFINSK